MFRSKRTALVKRLWKSRILYHEGNGETEDEFKSAAHSMLKRLKEKQLDIMVQSVESKGGETTECVLLPKADVKLATSRRYVSPHTLCCKLWRWPELQQGVEMKRLPCCSTGEEQGYICCNPYHWSLLLKTDRPTPPSSPNENHIERLATKDGFSPEPEETETGLTPLPRQEFINDDSTSGGGGKHWCTIAYWELRQRVGRLFPVVEPNFCVFQNLPHGDGMCLEILQQDSSSEAVRRTREKIGFGIILSREGDSVWAYNRGKYPVFVNSPTLDEPNCRTLVVRKLLPGYSLRIFDYDEALVLRETRDPELMDGPFDPSSVRISFAKGWGSCYSRQFVTSCPCWIEILLRIGR